MSALLTGGKLAMSGLPNIEPITLLLIVFSASFGWQMAMVSALTFCTLEVLLYGFGSWVITYYIYWSLLALVAGLILKKQKKLWVAVIIALIGTLLFSVIDAFVYACFVKVSGSSMSIVKVFTIYYAQGIYFVLIHLASSLVLVSVLFTPLSKLLAQIERASFG